MSLLKWKELAKSKTELGNKINYVHDAIMKHDIGQKTSQESFSKVFKPVTSKLDDVIDSNLNLRMPQRIKIPLRKGEVPNYGIDIEDEVEDMGLDDLFGDYVPPQKEKQLGPIPQIYVNPPDEPPKYDYDENVGYEIPEEELTMETLNELGLDNYHIIDDNIDDPNRTYNENIKYMDKMIKNAKKEKQRLNGSATAAKNKHKINKNEAELHQKLKKIENTRLILNEYINNVKEHKKFLTEKKV